MKYKKQPRFVKLIALCLVLILMVPMPVKAATEEEVMPLASYYLTSYQAYVHPAGGGYIQVYFQVTGTGYMDEIGALTIYIYESTDNTNWTYVETYKHYDNAGMLGYDDYFHAGHVDYVGVVGRYYKAYVCIWAGKDGDGDTRYFWTSSKKAT